MALRPASAPGTLSCLLALLLALPSVGLLALHPAQADGASVAPETLPLPMVDAAAVARYDAVYLFGGHACPSCAPSAAILAHHPHNGTLGQVAALPAGRTGAAAIEEYPYVYVFGGYNGTAFLADVVRFHPDTGEVRTMDATLPTGRAWMGVARDGPGFRLMGGLSHDGILAETLAYSVADDAITVGNSTLPEPRSHMAVAPTSWGTFLLGGYNESAALDSILSFDPGNGTFQEMGARLPTPVASASGASDGYNAFVFGGMTDQGATDAIVRYHPETDRVVVMSATLPSPRNATAAAFHGANFHVYGGYAYAPPNLTALDEVVRYDTIPGAPPSLAATLQGTTVHLAWTEPDESTYSFLWGHDVYRGREAGNETWLAYAQPGATTYADEPDATGAWHYVVRARDLYGRAGPESPRANVTFLPSPPTVPSEPRAVAAEALDHTSVRVRWTAPLSEGGSAVTAYHVYRRNASEPTPQRVATLGAAAREHVDAQLAANTTYHYSVSAENAVGEGDRSAEANATTPPYAAPSAPRALSAEGGLRLVDLSWAPPVDHGGLALQGYDVYRNDLLVAQLGPSTLAYTDQPLGNGTTYHYKVHARNGVGQGPAAQANATTHAAPSAPRNLAATTILTQGIRLDWQAPLSDGGSPVQHYRVYRSLSPSSNGTSVATTNALTYTDTGCPIARLCYYRVSAVNAVGEGALSNQASGLG